MIPFIKVQLYKKYNYRDSKQISSCQMFRVRRGLERWIRHKKFFRTVNIMEYSNGEYIHIHTYTHTYTHTLCFCQNYYKFIAQRMKLKYENV